MGGHTHRQCSGSVRGQWEQREFQAPSFHALLQRCCFIHRLDFSITSGRDLPSAALGSLDKGRPLRFPEAGSTLLGPAPKAPSSTPALQPGQQGLKGGSGRAGGQAHQLHLFRAGQSPHTSSHSSPSKVPAGCIHYPASKQNKLSESGTSTQHRDSGPGHCL